MFKVGDRVLGRTASKMFVGTVVKVQENFYHPDIINITAHNDAKDESLQASEVFFLKIEDGNTILKEML
jgi:hypothetical protein